jgi:predicted aspartyl protease
VIPGRVSLDGIPLITLNLAGEEWSAIIDTGFNGDLELPSRLQGRLNDQPVGRVKSALAGGQILEEDAYLIDFPFDGELVQATATFGPDSRILLGTHLMRYHDLRINFALGTVLLERPSIR